MLIISGFEPTRIISRDTKLSVNIDVLANSRHYEKWREDLALSKKLGISTLRIAVPWHRIEDVKDCWNWGWMDEYMEELRVLGIDPILDPLHHVSIPSYLTGGFLDEQFVERYCLFFKNIVERYDWVKKYTIVNEPVVTTYFATHEGVWYPFETGKDNFKVGLDNIEKVYRECITYLDGREHWYVDSAEYHQGVCESTVEFAEKMNSHRFQLLDRLLSGENPVRIDVLGPDYYPHCEFNWGTECRIENENPIGFYEIAKQYVKRYSLPIALTETNIRGFASDRQSWFVHMYKQCQKLEKEVDFRGVCWYPLIDCTDWDSLVTEPNKNIDPQGIIILNKEFERIENEFSDTIKNLNEGRIRIEDVKTYDYLPPLDVSLKGFK